MNFLLIMKTIGDLLFINFYQLFHPIRTIIMKKVRISRRDPNKILKAIDHQSPKKKSVKKATIDREQVKSLNLKLYSYEKNETIHSHRYKISEYENKHSNRKSNSQRNSPSNHEVLNISSQREKTQDARKSANFSELHQIKYKSSQKSPYLLKNSHTPRKNLFIASVRNNNSQSLKHVNFRSIRLSSLDNKETKQYLAKQDSETLKQAQKLMGLGQLRKSILMLKTLLKKNPQNLQALYTASTNWLKLGQIQRALSIAEKIKKKNPQFHVGLHIIIAKCHYKLKEPGSSLEKLEQALQWFPSSSQIFIERGKILAKEQKYLDAIKNYEMAYKLNPENQYISQKLIMTYFFLQNHEKVLEMTQNMLKNQECHYKLKYQDIRARTLIKLHKYKELIKEFKNVSDPHLIFYVGQSFYKIKDYSNALICLESSICGGEDSTRTIKMLLLIHVKDKNFYEAYHVLERSKHLQIKEKEIQMMKQYIEGTLMLMKRNIEEGIAILQKLKQNVFKISSKDQSILEIKNYIHPFLAYAYFCLGQFESCKKQYEIHKQKDLSTEIQGLTYNIILTQAIIAYDCKSHQESLSLFKSVASLAPNKLQPHFYLFITHITIFCQILEEKNERKQTLIEEASRQIMKCAKIAHKLQNNIGANIYYHKCILHCFMEEWKEAILCIDEAIERSEENYWKFFYVRGMILATLHNFMEAINDISIAINLKNTEPQPYILRARCFQIEGEGNNAFKDLQNYIGNLALRPKDQSIHKFAGQLLFENGAFEDAILAFNHESIEQVIENYDVFLTKSKTFFLLGQFDKASIQMEKSYKLNTKNNHNLFDSQMMKVMDDLAKASANFEQIINKINTIYKRMTQEMEKKRIFKQTQEYLMRAVCYFYLQRYEECIKELEISVKVKQKVVFKESLLEGSNQEDSRDTKTFSLQMHYNISLCHLLLGNHEKALSQVEKMSIEQSNSIYSAYQNYLKFIKGECQENKDFIEIQVFPNRNKFSNFLPKVSITAHQRKAQTKLCIPFPKVQPPQIFPQFDQQLLYQFHIDAVERKPEAPWIVKEENVITFTGKIQRYSRLQIEESIDQSTVKDINVDTSHIELRSLSSRRAKIIIDPSLEQKIDFQPSKKQMKKSFH